MSEVPLHSTLVGQPPKREAARILCARLNPSGRRTLSLSSSLSRRRRWFRGGLVFKAHGLLYHSTLGVRVQGFIAHKKYPPPLGLS